MFEGITPESIKKSILDRAAQAGLQTREGSFLDHLVGPVATELWKIYGAAQALVPIAYVDETSGGYIDLRCGEYGMTRKSGVRAKAAMTLTGKAGTVVPKGTAFLTAEGLTYLLADKTTLTGGEDKAMVEAELAGDEYNVEAGVIDRMVTTVPGLDKWSNETAAGGADPETDAALVGRLYDYLQKPATSGNVYHYEQWALEVPGIGAARVTPLWDGPGTVQVLVAGAQREPVDETVTAACATHIEALRPIGAAVTIRSAGGLAIAVAAVVTLDGSVTAAEVKAVFTGKLAAYLRDIAFREYTLLFNRVAFLLLDIDGVSDYTALTVNGGVSNVVIGADQVPVLGEVVIT